MYLEKNLTTADALSRAPVSSSTCEDKALQSDVTTFIAAVTNSLPATDQRLSVIQSHQAEDELRSQIIAFCSNSWPDKHQLPASLRPYWAGIEENSVSTRTAYFCTASAM